MANQKTGADAVRKAVSAICATNDRYAVKLNAFIGAAETAGIINSAEAAAAYTLLGSISASCLIWQKLAQYNSIQP